MSDWFNPVINNVMFYFNDRHLPSLNRREKKILMIATLALTLLVGVICYFVRRNDIQAAVLNGEELKMVPFELDAQSQDHPRTEIDLEKKLLIVEEESQEELLEEEDSVDPIIGSDSPDGEQKVILAEKDLEAQNGQKEEDFLPHELSPQNDGKVQQEDEIQLAPLKEGEDVLLLPEREDKLPDLITIQDYQDPEYCPMGWGYAAHGQFDENGKLHGYGEIHSMGGSSVKGQFKHGKLDGKGTIIFGSDPICGFTHSQGQTMKGMFKNGLLNGQGIFSWEEGKFWRKGEFKDGVLNGLGEIFYEGKRSIKQKGPFKDGVLHGPNGVEEVGLTIKEGHFEKGLLQGQGKRTIRDPQGTPIQVDEGEFRRGKLHGEGTCTYSNGRFEEGHFQEDRLHGPGKRKSANGTVEEGLFYNGEFLVEEKLLEDPGMEALGLDVAGETVENYQDPANTQFFWGYTAYGQFKDGVLHGWGKITSPGGGVAEGQFENGKLHGSGKIIFGKVEICGLQQEPGTIMEGAFVNGKLHGQGTLTWNQGNCWKKGEFKEGILNGPGKIHFLSAVGVLKTQEGQFKDGLLHGPEGREREGLHILRRGNFAMGLLDGQGKHSFYLGKEEGVFQKGVLHGKGTRKCPDGAVEEGKFKKGLLDGKGKRISPDDTVQEGDFLSGNFLGQYLDSSDSDSDSSSLSSSDSEAADFESSSSSEENDFE